jgi:hypothetical protein
MNWAGLEAGSMSLLEARLPWKLGWRLEAVLFWRPDAGLEVGQGWTLQAGMRWRLCWNMVAFLGWGGGWRLSWVGLQVGLPGLEAGCRAGVWQLAVLGWAEGCVGLEAEMEDWLGWRLGWADMDWAVCHALKFSKLYTLFSYTLYLSNVLHN